jgi:hypothetical protein
MFPFEPWVVGLHFGELGRWQVALPLDAVSPGPGDDEDDDEDDGNIEPPDDDDGEDDEDEEEDDEEDTLWARPRAWRAATHNDVL